MLFPGVRLAKAIHVLARQVQKALLLHELMLAHELTLQKGRFLQPTEPLWLQANQRFT